MSSNFFDTISAYESIAPYFNSLALDCSDSIWGTDVPGTSVYVPGGMNYCSLVATLNLEDGQEQQKDKLEDYSRLYNGNLNALDYAVANHDYSHKKHTNVFDILQSHPHTKKWNQIINKANWEGYIYQNPFVTLFAPIDAAVPHFSNLIQLSDYQLRPLCKAHTLYYPLDPDSLPHRKHQVRTTLQGFSPIVDGRNPARIQIYEMNYQLNNGLEYPELQKKATILAQYQADNGMLYLIDQMLEPRIVIE
jgi:uncharacterized surface protein with fasciclin (FAS1) repeats